MATDQTMKMNKRLEGKVAIITGGASGVGASSVRLFHENGAKVVFCDIQDDLGQALADNLGSPDVLYVHCDVSKEDEVAKLIDAAVSKFGRVDIMFNNAGVLDKTSIWSFLESTKADLDRVLGVNVVGSYLGALHAARVMVPQRSGTILFTASATTVIGGLSTHPYAVSKHAVAGMAKSLAAELGQYGIRVNAISPSGFVSGIGGAKMAQDMVPAVEALVSGAGNLKGQVLRADDVARAALFLASDEASYVSGLNLVVDGGFSVVNPNLVNALSYWKESHP